MATTPDDRVGYSDEEVAALNARKYIDDAKDFLVICINDLVRRGADRQDTLLAFEAALMELKEE